jgi:O-antigen/teichoic acid export membrane protein
MSDSLVKRYLYKLFTNLSSLAINLVTQAIIPRGLGPRAYGDFNFLTNFFTQVIGFLDMGTSIGFYTKLCQRPKESPLIKFYVLFIGAVAVVTYLFVTGTHIALAYPRIWPGQQLTYVYMAAAFAMVAWVLQILEKISDASGLTVSSEKAKVIQKLVGLLLILILFVGDRLTLTNFFYYNYFIMLALGGAFAWIIMYRAEPFKASPPVPPAPGMRQYAQEFYHFSHPLFVYSLVGLLTGLFDRWYLQSQGGSIEQGYFGLAYQIGAVCFLFSGAMTPLLTRELSIAFSQKDLTKMAHLFQRHVPLLYSVVAFFSCFIVAQAQKVVYLFAGASFKEGVAALAVMALYPIHQTYGQLSGSVFYATNQTGLYRNIGVIFMLLGVPITYLLLAPRERLGLGMGATGLATKMVIMQFIGVNAMLYFNTKQLDLRFSRYIAHQLVCIASLLAAAFSATLVVDRVLGLKESVFSSFLAAGILYSLIVTGLLFRFPSLFGLNGEDIGRILKKIPGLGR